MGMLKVGNWYKRKKDGKVLYCYKIGYTTGNLGYFSRENSSLLEDILFDNECVLFDKDLHDLIANANKSRLSTALGKHRSYLNKMIQQGVSEETYQKIKAKLTIDWNSDKLLHVNDRKHVPFTIKPINCTLPKHKEWLQNLMMQGCIEL